jgi:hypothetical protein
MTKNTPKLKDCTLKMLKHASIIADDPVQQEQKSALQGTN